MYPGDFVVRISAALRKLIHVIPYCVILLPSNLEQVGTSLDSLESCTSHVNLMNNNDTNTKEEPLSSRSRKKC